MTSPLSPFRRKQCGCGARGVCRIAAFDSSARGFESTGRQPGSSRVTSLGAASIEDFMGKRDGVPAPAEGRGSGSNPAGSTPPPLPFVAVKGHALLKDFVCEQTRKVRSFQGEVVKFFKTDKM